MKQACTLTDGTNLCGCPERCHKRDSVWLVALCLVMFGLGMTSHGLTNWQEAQRAFVAREMFERGEWLMPTAHGQAYIAKPPMIYWAQMSIAHARRMLGFEPFADEFELRLTVALGGLLGVLATYLAGRVILRDEDDPGKGHEAAWWGALGLATGVLFVRSSRIGELDVLIVPFVTLAIGALASAWRSAERTGKTAWGMIALATIGAAGAVMTKGPPALLVVALGGYASMIVLARGRSGSASIEPEQGSSAPVLRTAAGVVGAAALFAGGLALGEVESIWHALGAIIFLVFGWILGRGVWDALRPSRVRAWFFLFSKTHPLLVLGVPLLVFTAWSRSVAARVGGAELAGMAARELEDNLRVLVLDSPTKNLGFMVYGIAPMSLAALVAVVWLLREKPALGTLQRIPFVWLGLGYVAFSTMGKGVARYLTPLWPAVALAGGLGLAVFLRSEFARVRGAGRLRAIALLVMVVSGLAQAAWYGWAREHLYGARSPRGIVGELLPRIDPARLGVWRLDDPALDFYAGQRVERFGVPDRSDAAPLLSEIESAPGAYVLLAAEPASGHAAIESGAAFDAIAARGWSVERIETRASYVWRAEMVPIIAWRIMPGRR